MDGLDEFEKSLAAEKAQRERDERREHKHRHRRHRDDKDGDDKGDRDSHRHRRHRREGEDGDDRDDRGHRRRHRDRGEGDEDEERRRKRSRRDEGDDAEERSSRRHRHERHRGSHKSGDAKEDLPLPDEEKPASQNAVDTSKTLERDSWMTAPSSIDIDYIHRPKRPSSPKSPPKPQRVVHSRELNRGDEPNAPSPPSEVGPPKPRTVDYTFGDAGSSWRMTKLRAVFTTAEESNRPVEDVAMERFGSLEFFDDAREEKEELERRKLYGSDYDAKEKPSGEFYQERLLQIRKNKPRADEQQPEQRTVIPEEPAAAAPAIDQTALNRLRAQMMKAKLRRAPNAAQLEEEYNAAAANFSSQSTTGGPAGAVVLGAMDSRQLAGTRAEVKAVDTKRGRERGTVQDNEDMTIEDMVREERRTRHGGPSDAMRQAERIAKDGKFTADLDYMDDNAAKLARRVHKSEASLKNMAVSEFQKLNQALDRCPLCHHEDSGRPPVAPVVSLATRTFLTLPTEPEVSPGGAVVVPLTHRKNLLECDDDEWEELRNFMKSLTRMYHAQGREVVFYENAAQGAHLHRHAALVAVPIPYDEGAMAPAHFREAFLSSDAEWSQHRPVIDTERAAREGQGRMAFRRSIAKEMPYFHVWFSLDGGLGHVVEDVGGKWPKGDLFAREVIGGIVSAEPHIIKKQGRWARGGDAARVEKWKREWRKYDWTRVLAEG